MKILYNSSEVHAAIKKIFKIDSNKNFRRVAVVAYLGASAEQYLPDPEGIEIICNPEPGATSPNAIRSLRYKGAIVKFANKLHSKVYWSPKGCIITSANLSHRALSASGQIETGIIIEAKHFDIDRLIRSTYSYAVESYHMKELEKATRRIIQNTKSNNVSSSKGRIDYLSWYNFIDKSEWKLGWWDTDDSKPSKAALDICLNKYGVEDPNDYLHVNSKQVNKDDILLCFKIENNKISKIRWMYVDFVIKVDENDVESYCKDYPFQAIEVREISSTIKPFKLTPQFKKAFSEAVIKLGVNKIIESDSLVPQESLLKSIANYMRQK